MIAKYIGLAAISILVSASWLSIGMADGTVPPQKGKLFGFAGNERMPLRDEEGGWLYVEGYSAPPPPINRDDTKVIIGVIDSGAILDHPQIKGIIYDYKDFTGEGIDDVIGHGTVVTIRARMENNGLSTPMIIAKVANADGTIEYDVLLEAIEWITQKGAKIVNMSLGFREGSQDFSEICYLMGTKTDVLFVVAAGNYGQNTRTYPASCKIENVLCVMAADNNGKLADYSSVCSEGSGIVAPGSVRLCQNHEKCNGQKN